jgi:hypothetical protein
VRLWYFSLAEVIALVCRISPYLYVGYLHTTRPGKLQGNIWRRRLLAHSDGKARRITPSGDRIS